MWQKVTILLLLFAGSLLAQNPSPCRQVVNRAVSGQVLSAAANGNTPPCRWITSGGGGGATIPSVTNVIKGDGAGNGADTKVAITSPATAATINFSADNETVTLPNGTMIANTRNVNTTSPLTGGGALSADLTLGCATCGVTGSPLSQFASTTSAQLLATISNPTGTGSVVFNVSPALTGTPTTPTPSQNDNSQKIAPTNYVDLAVANALASTNPATSTKACTTTVLPAVTYNNGVSGIGATLTENSAAALVIDGYTVLLGDRLLIKNQASTFQNGVYTMTTLGTGIVPFVLTRALDFDQPSDINNTGPIGCQTGTVNAPGGLPTTWLLTTTVTTIGTDAITFSQTGFGGNTTRTICSGTVALGTSPIGSGAKASTVTGACTGLLTTDNIMIDFNADPTSTTGYQASANGMLTIIKFPIADTVNVIVANNTAASITPGAITLNYRVVR